MEWIALLVICFAGAIAIGVMEGRRDSRKVETIKERIRNLADFEPEDVFVSNFSLTGIAIDPNQGQLLLADEADLRRCTVPSVVSCEILEDDVQLAYVNRGSQLARAAVGGLLAGGVGTIVGGLSASQRNINKVKKIILRIVVDDFDKPNHDIVLLDWSLGKRGLKRDGVIYRAALEVAELWHSRVRAMIKATDTPEKGGMIVTNRDRVLALLRSTGVGLTDAEIRRRTGIEPHQQVNQICRSLAEASIVKREKGAEGHLVNRLAATAEPEADYEGEADRRTKVATPPCEIVISLDEREAGRLEVARSRFIAKLAGVDRVAGRQLEHLIDRAAFATYLVRNALDRQHDGED